MVQNKGRYFFIRALPQVPQFGIKIARLAEGRFRWITDRGGELG